MTSGQYYWVSPVEVRDELVLIVTHPRPEVGDTHVSLFGPPQVALWYEHVPHGQHPQTPQLLGSVEHHWGEPRGHLGVETYLDTGLDLWRERERECIQFFINYSVCNG